MGAYAEQFPSVQHAGRYGGFLKLGFTFLSGFMGYIAYAGSLVLGCPNFSIIVFRNLYGSPPILENYHMCFGRARVA